MEKMRMDQQNRAMELKQQEMQMNAELSQKQHEEKMMNDNMNAQADRETKIQIAEIQSLSYERNDIDNTADIAKATENALDVSKQNFEKMIRMKELQQEDRRMDIDEEQLKSREEIAKMKNKNTKKKK
jgi:CBS-domain-containing membrane protein